MSLLAAGMSRKRQYTGESACLAPRKRPRWEFARLWDGHVLLFFLRQPFPLAFLGLSEKQWSSSHATFFTPETHTCLWEETFLMGDTPWPPHSSLRVSSCWSSLIIATVPSSFEGPWSPLKFWPVVAMEKWGISVQEESGLWLATAEALLVYIHHRIQDPLLQVVPS